MGPSRSKMQQHAHRCAPQPQKDGDLKVQGIFTNGHKPILVILRSSVTPEFVKAFCAAHGISLEIQGNYYHLS